jgi:hypothetical protein
MAPMAMPLKMPGCLILLSAIFIIGCSQQGAATQPSSMYDRQEQALHDPFGYTPDLKKTDMSVSGEGDPNGLKRDLDHVFNP